MIGPDRWMQTYSGRQFFYNTAEADDSICLIDIAKSLSRQCRCYGHMRMPVSVAEHSCVVSEIIEMQGGSDLDQLFALLHDAHEAYIGDVIAPLKAFLLERYNVSIKGLADDIQNRIYAALNLPRPEPTQIQRIETADMMALAAERQLFMAGAHPWRTDVIEVPEYVFGMYGNWEPDDACRSFEKLYDRLSKSVAFDARMAAESVG
jgi:5'-nucleotidase